MEKEKIVAAYKAATKQEKDRITKEALKALHRSNINVTRKALHYWRERPMPKSPLAEAYRKAYEKALKQQQ